MKKLGLNSGYIGSDQRFSTNGIVGYDKLLLERKNRRFLPSISGIFLLDVFPATAAFSLRRLRSNYTGAAIRVRRSSDNNELNIGFNGEILDISTLNSFCSGTNGFVTTWYDQQGSNNATQGTAGSQPKIYDNSTGVVLENGKPAVDFDGINDGLVTISNIGISGADARTIFNIVKPDSNTSSNAFFEIAETTIGGQEFDFTTEYAVRLAGGVNKIWAVSSTAQSLLTIILPTGGSFSDDLLLYKNESLLSSTSLSNGAILTVDSTLGIGGKNRIYNGKYQEIIIYNTDQSANRTAIEANINNYYNIY